MLTRRLGETTGAPPPPSVLAWDATPLVSPGRRALRALPILIGVVLTAGAVLIVQPLVDWLVLAAGAALACTWNLALYLSRLLGLPSPATLDRLSSGAHEPIVPTRCPLCGTPLMQAGGGWSFAAQRNLGAWRCRGRGPTAARHGWHQVGEPLLVELRFERWSAGDREGAAA